MAESVYRANVKGKRRRRRPQEKMERRKRRVTHGGEVACEGKNVGC